MHHQNCILIASGVPSTTSSAMSTMSQSQGNIANKQPVLAKKSAPASISTVASGPASSPELLRCKRRINFGGLGYSLPQAQPATVARRNERERNRVKMVNMGFATLRNHVPHSGKKQSAKMSKVDTLKSAIDYIKHLQRLLNETNENSDVSVNSSTG